MGVFKLFLAICIVFVSVVIYKILNYTGPVPTPLATDGWWGEGERPDKEDESIKKLSIHVTDAELSDLRYRLQHTKFQQSLEGGDFNYGFQATYMKEMVHYWLNKFDWRKQEKELNRFNHYKTSIEGIGVHFIHEKPKTQSKETIPLLIVHGWPGSIWNFHKLIPLLMTDHPHFNFELICPSIPGYGYSDASRKKGFDPGDAARIFMKLMLRLGYQRFYVQGGDIGFAITKIMALVFPQHVIGMHSNFIVEGQTPKIFIKRFIGSYFPTLIYEPDEVKHVRSYSHLFYLTIQEMGYNLIQSTKPDTVGIGLTDSPAGLAAYILEKYSTATNISYRNHADGGMTLKFTMDELLTNVMIYWTNQNIVSTMRMYKEMWASENTMDYFGAPVSVPAGLAYFPNEFFTPRTLAAEQFKDIVQYTLMPRGGHFGALEEPELLADDIRNFIIKLKARQNMYINYRSLD